MTKTGHLLMGIYLAPTQEIVDIHHNTALYHFVSGGQKNVYHSKMCRCHSSGAMVSTPGGPLCICPPSPLLRVRHKDSLQKQGAQCVSIQYVQEWKQELYGVKLRQASPGSMYCPQSRELISPKSKQLSEFAPESR